MKLREFKIRWGNGEDYLIDTIRSMEIQKITITRSDALGGFLTDINWELLDKALASLAKRLGRERSLEVEIQAVGFPEDYRATLATEEKYLPKFRKRNGRVKFLDPTGKIFSFPSQKPQRNP